MVAAVDALFTQCYRCCYLMEYTLYVCLQFLGGSDALRLFDCLASVYQIEINICTMDKPDMDMRLCDVCVELAGARRRQREGERDRKCRAP